MIPAIFFGTVLIAGEVASEHAMTIESVVAANAASKKKSAFFRLNIGFLRKRVGGKQSLAPTANRLPQMSKTEILFQEIGNRYTNVYDFYPALLVLYHLLIEGTSFSPGSLRRVNGGHPTHMGHPELRGLGETRERYNADLANALGNPSSATISILERYCDGVVPKGKRNEVDDADAEDLDAYRARWDRAAFCYTTR